MAKYKIAWMPGDGIGNDVMDAARIVLDRHEARRRVRPLRHRLGILVQGRQRAARSHDESLQGTTCGLFGAITSKPQDEAKEELAPELKDKKLVYFSPIVEAAADVQPAHEHAAVQELSRQPAELSRHAAIANPSGEEVLIDQVVFRENTEGIVRRRRVLSAARVGLHRAVRESEDEDRGRTRAWKTSRSPPAS